MKDAADQQLAAMGITPTSYDHRVYYIPDSTPGCAWAGLSASFRRNVGGRRHRGVAVLTCGRIVNQHEVLEETKQQQPSYTY